MNLSAMNIKTMEFSTAFVGCSRAEVKAYLDKLSSEVDELLTSNQNLQLEIDELNLKIERANTLEKELRNSLVTQKENETKQPDLSQRDSNEIIREAELKAVQIVNRAKESANLIRNAVLTLREQKELIIAKLKAIVATQTGLFETKSELPADEKEKIKNQQSNEEIDVDVNDIVNKIL